MPIYSADTELGQTLISAKNLDDARESAYSNLRSYRKELGYTPELKSINLATEEDISWVEAMGGRIPEEV